MRKALIRKVTQVIDSISLKAKIIAIFFAFIIVPLVIFTYIAYDRINKLVLSQTLNSASQSFNETVSILNKYFINMNNAMQNMLFDEDIYKIASKDTTNYSPIQQLGDYKTLIKRFDYIQKGADVDHIRFYINVDSYYSENNVNIFSLDRVLEKDWYKSLLAQGENRIWSPPFMLEDDASGNGFFTYASIIFRLESLYQPLAVLKVDVGDEKIEAVLKNAAITENSSVFITDRQTVIWPVSKDRPTAAGNKLVDDILKTGSQQWEFIKSDKNDYIVRSQQLELTDWYVVAIIPQSDIVVLQNVLKNEMILILILLATISYFLAYVTSNSSLKRIFLLNREMKQIEGGNLKEASPR